MAGHKDKGIYVGVFAGQDACESPPVRLRYTGPKHILCFGPPGAAKSMGLAVEQAHLPRSEIWIDPKRKTRPFPTASAPAWGNAVIVLNPFGVFADELPHLKDCGWNPLLQPTRKAPTSPVMRVASRTRLFPSRRAAANSVFRHQR